MSFSDVMREGDPLAVALKLVSASLLLLHKSRSERGAFEPLRGAGLSGLLERDLRPFEFALGEVAFGDQPVDPALTELEHRFVVEVDLQ